MNNSASNLVAEARLQIYMAVFTHLLAACVLRQITTRYPHAAGATQVAGDEATARAAVSMLVAFEADMRAGTALDAALLKASGGSNFQTLLTGHLCAAAEVH